MEVEQWRRHFQRMAEGKIRPNHDGHYIVEEIRTGGKARQPPIKFVTPADRDIALTSSQLNIKKRGGKPKIRWVTSTAQDVAMAKSELKKKSKKDFTMRPPGIPVYD